jgi:hypothetical protein
MRLYERSAFKAFLLSILGAHLDALATCGAANNHPFGQLIEVRNVPEPRRVAGQGRSGFGEAPIAALRFNSCR